MGSGTFAPIPIATVPPSDKRPIYVIDDEGLQRAYIRIADENIVASTMHGRSGDRFIDFPKQSICPTDLFKLLKLRKKTNYAMYAIDID